MPEDVLTQDYANTKTSVNVNREGDVILISLVEEEEMDDEVISAQEISATLTRKEAIALARGILELL